MQTFSLARRLTAEAAGSALLTAVVIGSGIAAARLSPTDIGLQLLENAAATGAGLYVLILVLAPMSGAHLNPIVSLVDAALGGRPWRDVLGYIPAQILGCVVGAILANLIFDLPLVSISTKERLSPGHILAEVVATAGLVIVIFVLARSNRPSLIPAAVGTYIGAAYFFTSSTSFANPAITIGRIFSNTFAGIDPGSAPWFIVAQLGGGLLGFWAVKSFFVPVGQEAAITS